MKRVIRRGVFETNSSSTHTVTIVGKDKYTYGINEKDIPEIYTDFKVDPRYNKVLVDFGEFGWGPNAYNDPMIKLSYALTMIASTECMNISSSNLFFESKGFKDINDLIADKYNCKGIFIDSDIDIRHYGSDPNSHPYIEIDGYIDHQSYEVYNSLDDFLSEYNLTLEDFIFNKNVVLIIKNDNAYDDEYDFNDALHGGMGYNKAYIDQEEDECDE